MARRPASPPDPRPTPGEDRRRGLALVPVSRETEERFAIYSDLLARWQGIKNLVGPSTLAQVWTRHLADSAQLVSLVPDALQWADLGSGAGFPGLVIAILLRHKAGARVHLIESNARKCAFLREAARATDAAATVHNGRIEQVLSTLDPVDVLTARALAPLPVLIELGKIPLRRGASALFLKSKAEIAATDLSLVPGRISIWPSKTAPDGRIVMITPTGETPDPVPASPADEANGRFST